MIYSSEMAWGSLEVDRKGHSYLLCETNSPDYGLHCSLV
jgi:hypothetical protein